MATWTVGSLREQLDEWGDHIPVIIEVEQGARSTVIDTFEVADTSRNGELRVALTVET